MIAGTPASVRANERGEGLIEVAVAAAVVGIVLAAIVSGMIAATRQFGANAIDEALRHLVEREARVAADILKYEGGAVVPETIQTTAPLSGASPIPVQLSIASTTLTSGGGYRITVSARTVETGRSATVTTTLPAPVPLPASTVAAPLDGAAPL